MVRKVIDITTTDTSYSVKKLTTTQKLMKIFKKILDHDHCKHITTQKFNKLMADDFVAKLAQEKLATKDDIADLVQETLILNLKILIKKLQRIHWSKLN